MTTSARRTGATLQASLLFENGWEECHVRQDPRPGARRVCASVALVAPNPGRLDRDALIFAAGQAAGQKSGLVWRSCTAVLTVLCAGLGTTLAFRPTTHIEVRDIEVVTVPAREESPTPIVETSPRDRERQAEWAEGMRLRENVLRNNDTTLSQPPVAWSVEHPLTEREVPGISALHNFARP